METTGKPVPLLPHTHIHVVVYGLDDSEDLIGAKMCVCTDGGVVTCGGQQIRDSHQK